jgi:two-component system NtrC family response regulator
MELQIRELEIESDAPPIPTAARRQVRVLVVEDDPDMRRLVAHMLEREGYEVTQASSGIGLLAGMELLKWNEPEDTFDVIVSDVQMPDLTALDVLGGLSRSPGIPIVLMTAYGTADTRARARALGAVAFLDKPLDWEKLRLALRNVLAAT